MNQLLERQSFRDRFFIIGIVIVTIILIILIGSLLKSYYMEYEVVGKWKPYKHKFSNRIILIFHSENSWEYNQYETALHESLISWEIGTWERDGLVIKMKTSGTEIWAKIDTNGITIPADLNQNKSPLLFQRVRK